MTDRTPQRDRRGEEHATARGVVGAAGQRMRVALEELWNSPRIAVVIGVGVAAAWDLVAGWWTPRGPLTTREALWSLLISVTVGALAGLVHRGSGVPRTAVAAADAALRRSRRRHRPTPPTA